MSVRVYSVDVYNFKNITIKSKVQENVKDKFVGNYSYGLEKYNEDYIKKELKVNE